MAPGDDGSGLFGYPLFESAATNRSRDNDNTEPVEQEIDDANRGTSMAAGFATAAGAVIRDYFAQGFYPTGTRQAAPLAGATDDRMPRLSGSLVRAALVASANFLENTETRLPGRVSPNDLKLETTRAGNMGTVSGADVGVIGNGIQGYGRIVLDQVLPLPNYPPTRGIGLPNSVEYPASGLLVFDSLGTDEPTINNTRLVNEHTFKLNGVNATTVNGTRLIEKGMLRIALSWPDPPSLAGSAGKLVNDLDLEVESPGPDNCYDDTDVAPDGTLCSTPHGTCVGGPTPGLICRTAADCGGPPPPARPRRASTTITCTTETSTSSPSRSRPPSGPNPAAEPRWRCTTSATRSKRSTSRATSERVYRTSSMSGPGMCESRGGPAVPWGA